MSNTKTLIVAAAGIAALSTILLQRRQNTSLVTELAATREEKARLESQLYSTVTQAADESAPRRVQELESEVARLRGTASRAARAEARVAQLELQTQRARQSGGAADSSNDNSDSLAQYIGAGVPPPANLDPAYGKDGLVNAIQLAAQKAGINVKRIGVDESEFPFLLGVAMSDPGDWEKLKTQLKSMEGYAYFGSVGDDNKNVFSITPHQTYPAGADETINHRMTLRMQRFYDKFTAAQN